MKKNIVIAALSLCLPHSVYADGFEIGVRVGPSFMTGPQKARIEKNTYIPSQKTSDNKAKENNEEKTQDAAEKKLDKVLKLLDPNTKSIGIQKVEDTTHRFSCRSKGTQTGFSGSLFMEWGKNDESDVIVGFGGLVGYMGGKLLLNGATHVVEPKEESDTATDSTKTSQKKEMQHTLHIRPGITTGLYGKIGRDFGKHGIFATAGWTLAQFNLSSSTTWNQGDKTITLASSKEKKWKSGLSLGTGYNYKITPNLRFGLTYVATIFPGVMTFTSKSTDAGVAANKQLKIQNNERSITTQPMWNHTVALSASVALNKKDA